MEYKNLIKLLEFSLKGKLNERVVSAGSVENEELMRETDNYKFFVKGYGLSTHILIYDKKKEDLVFDFEGEEAERFWIQIGSKWDSLSDEILNNLVKEIGE